MTKLMTEREFADKVDNEGGIFAALEGGLQAADCEPGRLQDAWKALEYAYSKHIFLEASRVSELLDEITS